MALVPHQRQDMPDKRPPQGYVRFYFMAAGDAELFRREWGGVPVARWATSEVRLRS